VLLNIENQFNVTTNVLTIYCTILLLTSTLQLHSSAAILITEISICFILAIQTSIRVYFINSSITSYS